MMMMPDQSPYDYPGESAGYPPPEVPEPRDPLAKLIADLRSPLVGPGGQSSRSIANEIRKRWLVLLPGDELVERISRALCRKFAAQQLDLPHDEYVDRYWPTCADMARAVLVALAGDPS